MTRRLKIPAMVVSGLLLVYTLVGFLLVPYVVRSQAIAVLDEQYQIDLAIDRVRFNPFTLVATIDDLSMRAADGEQLLAFNQLLVDLQWRSLVERAPVFRAISLTAPFVHVHIAEDGTVNLVEAFAGDDVPAPDPAGEEEAETLPVVIIEAFDLVGGEVRFTDDQDGRGFDRRLTPLDLELRHFTTRPGQAADLASFLIRLADGGEIEVTGDLSAVPAAFDIRIAARELPLAIMQPYVPDTLAAEVRDGRLFFDFTVRYGQSGQPGMVAVDGSAGIDDLLVEVEGRDEPVLAWERLALNGVSLALQPDNLTIDEVAIDGLDSSFRIYRDGETNVGKVLRSTMDEETDNGTENGAEAAQAETDADEGAAFPFSIGHIVIDGSTLMYSDEMIRPPVSIRIDGLGGEIAGLESAPDSRMTVSILGTVGGHGRADIAGGAMLFAPAADLDAKVSFENIELTDFSPYAGKFAGYEILQGKLFLDVHYTLVGSRIQGDNRALFDQFELGDRVDSDAPRLPIKFALSLLRDRHGRIEVTLPVEGDIDDPEFRFGHLVWQAMVNVVTRIATAPFSFIASVFGGGPDMEFAEFAAGSAALDAAERDKFAPLATAMNERPRLLVEIQGLADPLDDRNHLQQQMFEALLAESPTLDEAYDRHFGDGAAVALREELAAGVDDSEDAEAELQAMFDDTLRTRLLEAQQVDDEELVLLAYNRGQQVMDTLVADGGVESDRVFVRRGEIARPGEGTLARLILEAR